MKIDTYSKAGEVTGSIELRDEVFGVEVRRHLFWEVINWQRAKRRAGTHATKGRSEVRGGGKKPWKQKGTGRARQGTTRAPHWVGGGVVFGPQPRDYGYAMPKKKRRAALISALSFKAAEQALYVVDDLAFESPRTKQVVKLFEDFKVEKGLLIDATETANGSPQHNEPLRLSARNLPNAKYLAVEGLNVEDVIGHKHLFLTRAAVEALYTRLGV